MIRWNFIWFSDCVVINNVQQDLQSDVSVIESLSCMHRRNLQLPWVLFRIFWINKEIFVLHVYMNMSYCYPTSSKLNASNRSSFWVISGKRPTDTCNMRLVFQGRRNKLGCYTTDSLYNLNSSSTDLQYSALGGCTTGYGGYTGCTSGSVLPRVQIRSGRSSVGSNANRVSENNKSADANQQITFRQSRCSSNALTVLSTNPTESLSGATVTRRVSMGQRSSMHNNSHVEPVPVPILSMSATASTGLQELQKSSQQSSTMQQSSQPSLHQLQLQNV